MPDLRNVQIILHEYDVVHKHLQVNLDVRNPNLSFFNRTMFDLKKICSSFKKWEQKECHAGEIAS